MRYPAFRRVLTIAVAACLVGCGGDSTPPTTGGPSGGSPSVELGDSAETPATTDPTPVLPIPEDTPGRDPDAAAKVPINPIPDDAP